MIISEEVVHEVTYSVRVSAGPVSNGRKEGHFRMTFNPGLQNILETQMTGRTQHCQLYLQVTHETGPPLGKNTTEKDFPLNAFRKS